MSATMSGVLPPPPCSLISLLFFLLFFPIAVASAGLSVTNTSIEQCYSVDCGDGVEIRYPFWLFSGKINSSYCGYPNMGFACQDGHPVLELGGGSYQVVGVQNVTRTITLQNVDLMGSDCPRPRHSLTLWKGDPLAYTDTGDYLFFFFNCSGEFPDDHKLPCLSGSGGNSSYAFPQGSVPAGYDWTGGCQDSLLVATLKTETDSSASSLSSAFAAILHRGFQLSWRAQDTADCARCEETGGNCGRGYGPDGRGNGFLCFCSGGTQARDCSVGVNATARDGVDGPPPHRGVKGTRRKMLIGIIAGISGFLLSSFAIFYCWNMVNHYNSRVLSNNTQNVEGFLEQYGSLAPKRYKYAEVKKMTRSFHEKLGEGGYGVVFKGELSDGHLVAVKVLSKSKENGDEFINEVASISRTHHVNVVSLLGFCCEGSKRALIYEFMHNGSLDKFIFSREARDMTALRWKKLYDVAIGIAHGLEYLHRGCNTRIVHFDIKPHNILLDEDFCPKISDFGLAKSCRPKQSILSIAEARGTIGYIAPEVFSRNFGAVTSKSDVYSYGMMVLEMVGGRRNADTRINNISEKYFPDWIYEHFDDVDALKCYGIIDETEEVARKMILVALWCLQTIPSHRPSMSKVVEMLESDLVDLQRPPKPYLFSPLSSNVNSPTQTMS